MKILYTVAALIALVPVLSSAAEPQKGRGKAEELMVRQLEAASGKEVRMLTVEYAPGEESPPHRHNAQTFVYVLEGAVRMQIEGFAPTILKAGDTFYESPADVHLVSANASKTERARFLVFMVSDRGAPIAVSASAATQE